MLNKATIEVLSSIAPISSTPNGGNPVVIKYPETIVSSSAGDILISYDIRATEVGEFEPMPIYDMSKFLSTFKLFSEDRVVKRIDSIINISDGSATVNYILDSEKACGYQDRSTAFTTTEAVPTVCEFVMSKENLKNLRSASGIFKDLDEVIFTTTDTGVNVSLGATGKFNAKSNNYSINFLAKSQKEFSIKLPVGNLNAIPVSDYILEVKYNSAKDAYRLIMKSKELENFKILMSLKV